MKKPGKYLFYFYLFAVPFALFYFSLKIKMPLMYKLRQWEFTLFALLLLLNLQLVVKGFKDGVFKGKRTRVISSFLLASFAIVSSSFFFFGCYEYSKLKTDVFSSDEVDLKELGRHFIVGYRDNNYGEIKALVERKAIGGVFLTARNVKKKSIEEIKNEISYLQNIQKKNGLPPLFIATDQEGGIVSRCSPPLKALPSLSSIVDECNDDNELEFRVKRYAFVQSMELSELGFNLNFSPVVDLKNSSINHVLNLHTRTDLRAISDDKDVVTKVALIYSKVSEKNGVITTLKHFPGLSFVGEDTHLFTGSLNKSEKYLSKNDWIPFRDVSAKTNAFIMLGHVLLKKIDNKRLSSCSKKIVSEIIRGKWKHKGILITDDLNMGPVVKSEGGIGGFSVRALNAGVDLLLISYDGDQYYRAMASVLKAKKEGRLDFTMLDKSKERINREW